MQNNLLKGQFLQVEVTLGTIYEIYSRFSCDFIRAKSQIIIQPFMIDYPTSPSNGTYTSHVTSFLSSNKQLSFLHVSLSMRYYSHDPTTVVLFLHNSALLAAHPNFPELRRPYPRRSFNSASRQIIRIFLFTDQLLFTAMADSDNESGGHNAGGELSAREQDRFLPIANVSRIMKKALPANAKISKDAKETVQECVSEFISFITGEASDKCQREKRKTINGDDLLWAMTTLGFEEYVEPLKVYLAKYREMEGEKTTMGRQGEKDGSSGGGGGAAAGGGGSGGGVSSGGYNDGGAGGMYGGGMQNNMIMGRQQHHQQMYNSGSYHQMGLGLGSPKGSLGRSGSIGGGSGGASTVKPR